MAGRPNPERLGGRRKAAGKLTPRVPRTPGTYRISIGEGLGRGIEVTEAQLRALVKAKKVTPAVFRGLTGKPY